MGRSRSWLAWTGAATGLAFALWRSDRDRARALEPLRPHGRRDSPENATLGPSKRGDRAASGTAGDRGRGAEAPREIPPRGLWEVAKRTASGFSKNEIMYEAGGVTFFALLSLVPAITALVSIYGLFSDPTTIARQLDDLSGIVPSGGMDIISEQVHRLTQSSSGGLSAGAIIGVLAALWSANSATKALFSSLNDVYGQEEGRGFINLSIVSLAFTAGGLITLIVGVGLIVVLPIVFKALGLDGVFAMAVQVLRIPIMALAIMFGLALLYRYGANRRPPRWRWVTWGGAFGALAWIALSLGFSWYVAHFGSYNKTYGSLGAVIGFMTWIWLSTTIVLVGAQINAELEAQTGRDSTVGATRAPGHRKADAADRVEAATG